MNRVVESGKTLLVDGPASVAVVSGKVEVFGNVISGTTKIVIREGKRLPFAVEEKATFNISLGENASVEEVEGSTIPSSWSEAFKETLELQAKPATIMVIGNVDSGKTSFCTYLINRLLREKRKIAFLDGDLGQSDVGPPCTLAYTFVTKPITDLFNLYAENAFFVGVTSPSTAIKKVIEGLNVLKREILGSNPDFIVIDTDGWVEGEEAIVYKVQLAKELNPNVIFCIQQKDELASLLNSFEDFKKVIVDSPQAIKQRSREKRKSLRELGYIKYLRNAKVQAFPLSWLKIEEDELLGLGKGQEKTSRAGRIYAILGMKPLHFAELKDKICIVIGKRRWISGDNLKKLEESTKKEVKLIRKGEEEGLLLALYNADRKFLGVGVLNEIDYARKTIKILTPVSKEISIIALGKVKLDKNFKETPAFVEEGQIEFTGLRKLF